MRLEEEEEADSGISEFVPRREYPLPEKRLWGVSNLLLQGPRDEVNWTGDSTTSSALLKDSDSAIGASGITVLVLSLEVSARIRSIVIIRKTLLKSHDT